jgi:hypothetical protein
MLAQDPVQWGFFGAPRFREGHCRQWISAADWPESLPRERIKRLVLQSSTSEPHGKGYDPVGVNCMGTAASP